MKILPIGNIYNSIIPQASFKKQGLNFTSNPLMQEAKTIELPDIRSEQILLPDNKIWLPKGSKPADFYKNNLSFKVPKAI